MRLVVISDTHGFHRTMGEPGYPALPEGDVLIHCGDYSRDYGSAIDTERFAAWMSKQKHAHKIVCPGNHDYAVYENPAWAANLFRKSGIHMIGQKPLTINGVVFDGGPWMPLSGREPPWGFEMEERDRERLWSRVHDDVDVLVSHVPPHGILDHTLSFSHLGCPVLREHVYRIRPRVHLFGHVHESRGSKNVDGIDFVNVSSNSRGKYVRDDLHGITFMTMRIYDAITYDLENQP